MNNSIVAGQSTLDFTQIVEPHLPTTTTTQGVSMRTRMLTIAVTVLGGGLVSTPLVCSAQSDTSFLDRWEQRVSESQAQQPHWITPLVTVTPRLEQELRSDFAWRTASNGTETTNYGGGKGLELIPFRPIELIIGIPPYVVHRDPKSPNGFGDTPLLLKYRVLARDEAHGNDIVTLFLGTTLPTGGKANGNQHVVVTPSLAAGKGWGAVDVQGTFGVNLPAGNAAVLGHPMLYNVAMQYHTWHYLWPEVEVNGTAWRDGSNDGKQQLFITPGIVLGRFKLHDRLGFTAGAGFQVAVTAYHQYNHNGILSLRMPF
jgi:hypothetical protein